MLEAIRSNDNVIGYCVHALTAGDWIIGAGLLDLWRNPKGLAYEKTKEGNMSKIAVLRTGKRNYYSGENVEFSTTIINENKDEINKIKFSVDKILGKKIEKTIYTNEFLSDVKNGITELEKIQLGNSLDNGEYQIKVSLINNGSVDYSTTINFDVFFVDRRNKNLKVALVKEDKKLTDFLKKYNISYEIFNEKTDNSTTVIINQSDSEFISSKDGNITQKSNTNIKSNFKKLIENINLFVADGGNAIFLKIPGKTRKRIGPNLTFVADGIDYLPQKPIKNISQGLWDGILHINSKHKFFKNLPVNVNMSGVYENIAPTISLRDFKGENIVQTIAFDRIPDGNILKRNYIGSGEVWSGSDLSIAKHGKGEMILSTLKLIENLNYDPVSEIVLLNIINYFR
jgi:hypothetical protein